MRAWLSRLVPRPRQLSPLYERVVTEAHAPHWYLQGQVPDTIDGRFAVLASLLALASVRLERGGEAAQRAGIDLTERFIADMDAEIRQLGIGDPSIGKQVGGMVGALGGRVGAWRSAVSGDEGFAGASLAGGSGWPGSGMPRQAKICACGGVVRVSMSNSAAG